MNKQTPHHQQPARLSRRRLLTGALAGGGALLLAASDKPAESAIPTPEQAAQVRTWREALTLIAAVFGVGRLSCAAHACERRSATIGGQCSGPAGSRRFLLDA